MRRWADADESSDEEVGAGGKQGAARFETAPDVQGIKTVIEYTERGGVTYKVTRRVKTRSLTRWTNKAMEERKRLKKFGKVVTNDPATEASLVKKSEEEVIIEVTKKPQTIATKDDAEDRFHEESLDGCMQLTKEKKVWTAINRERQLEREEGTAPAAEEKPAASGPALGGAAAPVGTKYVPPSVRAQQGKGFGKDGKDPNAGQEASLRITNLSEFVREGDLQELFGQFGRLQRVYLAKHVDTQQSKGFAFVTYFQREHAQLAIDKLNGHGYDNLIIQVQWAKPRA